MRRYLPPSLIVSFTLLLMAPGCSSPASSTPPPHTSTQVGLPSTNRQEVVIPAKDPRFHYDGRVDLSLANGIGLIWQATRVSIDIEGDKLALVFAHAEGANFFDVQVDDKTAVIEVPAGKDHIVDFPLPIGSGRHHLTLFKRSEAQKGWVIFSGLQLKAGAQAWASAKPPAELKFEFFGDSITAGACNEDGPVDQWENLRTHNSALSYAAVTAAAFAADYRNISVSGMGMVTGYVDVRAPQIWDRLYPTATSPRADLTPWAPNVVFINLGENDISFTQNNNQPLPASFTDTYVGYVRAIRTAYPRAEIVLLRGGMGGGAKNLTLRTAWDSAVARLEAEDAKLTHFVFTHYSELHPRVADHQALADELITWLKTQPFVAPANR